MSKRASMTISTSFSSEDDDDGESDSAGGMTSPGFPVPRRAGPGVGGMGASIYDSFKADFVFSLAMSLIRRALLGLADPLMRLVFLWRAGVAATQLVGTCTDFLKSDVTRALSQHRQFLPQVRHVHPSGHSSYLLCRSSQWNVSYTSIASLNQYRTLPSRP
jgi:hypothetical protein